MFYAETPFDAEDLVEVSMPLICDVKLGPFREKFLSKWNVEHCFQTKK